MSAPLGVLETALETLRHLTSTVELLAARVAELERRLDGDAREVS